MHKHWTTDRIMQFIFGLIVITVLILLLNYLSAVLVPFGAAFLIAYILDPLVNKLQKKIKFRIIAVLAVLFCFTALITIGLIILIPQITEEIQKLGVLLSKLLTDSSWRGRLNDIIPEDLWDGIRNLISVERIAESMRSLDFWKDAQTIISKVLPGALGVLSGTATVIFWLIGAVLIVMYLIFIMLDMPKLRVQIKNFIPSKYKEEAAELAKEMDYFMASYFRAQTIVALSVGTLFAISFSIIGFPMGFLFGFFIGALNMIPYLQTMSIPLALVLALSIALIRASPFGKLF